jgi:protein-S-isoprenylcysteine O-methyltransferase Ste14
MTLYAAVLLVLIGWSIWFASPFLLGYAAAAAVAFHLRVVLHEEPRLERRFPEQWRAYRSTVPRWFRPDERHGAA